MNSVLKNSGKYFLWSSVLVAILSIPYFFSPKYTNESWSDWEKINFPFLSKVHFIKSGDSLLFMQSEHGLYKFLDSEKGFERLEFENISRTSSRFIHFINFDGRIIINRGQDFFELKSNNELEMQKIVRSAEWISTIFYASEKFIYLSNEVGSIERIDLQNKISEVFSIASQDFVMEQLVVIDDSLFFYRTNTGKILSANLELNTIDSFPKQPAEYSSLLFLNDEKNLISVGESGNVSLLLPNGNWKNLFKINLEFGESIVSFYSGDDKNIYAGTSFGKIFRIRSSSSSVELIEDLSRVDVSSYTFFQNMTFVADYSGVDIISNVETAKVILNLPRNFYEPPKGNLKPDEAGNLYLLLMNGALYRTDSLNGNWKQLLPPVKNYFAGNYNFSDSSIIILGQNSTPNGYDSKIRIVDRKNYDVKYFSNKIVPIQFVQNDLKNEFAKNNNGLFRIDYQTSTIIPLFNAGFIGFAYKFRNGKLFVSANEGLFESLDDGKNWKKILAKPDAPAINDIYEFADGSFLAATDDRSCLFSSDGGKTFSERNKGLTAGRNFSIFQGKDGELIQLTLRGIFSSDNNGMKWNLIQPNFDPFLFVEFVYTDRNGNQSVIANHIDKGFLFISPNSK